MTFNNRVVVKLGGSLLVQPDLVTRLNSFLQSRYRDCQVSLIVGGGQIIDSLRELDRVHHCDAVAMHWLCIRTLRTTFDLLAMWMPTAMRVDSADAFARLKEHDIPGIYLVAVDAFYDLNDQDRLPCDWSTTSDSLAALLAQRLGSTRLCLLKSCEIPAELSLQQAADLGLADAVFPMIAAKLDVTIKQLHS